MDYPDDAIMEDMGSADSTEFVHAEILRTPSPPPSADSTLESIDVLMYPNDVSTESDDGTTQTPVLLRIKEEVVEACELASEQWVEPPAPQAAILEEVIGDLDEGIEKEGEEEERDATSGPPPQRGDRKLRYPMRTRAEKQIDEIEEENDKESYTKSFNNYMKTESSDKAAIHATVHKQKLGVNPMLAPYITEGFYVCEMFPKKNYDSYYMVGDGHRYLLNTRKGKGNMYRCKYHWNGCVARIRIEPGFIGKANQHTCYGSSHDGLNFHYICIYCNEKFDDLSKRKDHILNVPHFNAPWPMDEELCVFADFTSTINLVKKGVKEADDTVKYFEDKMVHRPLPTNFQSVSNRFFMNSENAICLCRPGSDLPPIFPKPELYPVVPHNTPKSKMTMMKGLINASQNGSPAESEVDSSVEDVKLKFKNAELPIKKKKKDSLQKALKFQDNEEDNAPLKVEDVKLKVKNVKATLKTKKKDGLLMATKFPDNEEDKTPIIIDSSAKDVKLRFENVEPPAKKKRKNSLQKAMKLSDCEENTSIDSSASEKKEEKQMFNSIAADIVLKIRNSRKSKIVKNKEAESNEVAPPPCPVVPQKPEIVLKKDVKKDDLQLEDDKECVSVATLGRRKSNRKHEQLTKDDSSGRSTPASVQRNDKKDEEIHSMPQKIENIIEEYENKIVLHCDLCNVELNSLKERADHDMSDKHQENKKKLLEENEKSKASLTFDKPIFTEEFLKYNKALEAELRGLRKGAVELEEQNAVLSSHIAELNNVVMELRNAKLMMQRHHSTLDGHLKDLKSELSKVFTAVLSTDVSAENFNETFNKLSVAVTGRGSGKRPFDGISTKLKRHLKQARIDTVAL